VPLDAGKQLAPHTGLPSLGNLHSLRCGRLCALVPIRLSDLGTICAWCSDNSANSDFSDSWAHPLASAELSRRVYKVVGYPALSEMGDHQRREFHEGSLEAESFEDLPGEVAGGDLEGRAEPAEAAACPARLTHRDRRHLRPGEVLPRFGSSCRGANRGRSRAAATRSPTAWRSRIRGNAGPTPPRGALIPGASLTIPVQEDECRRPGRRSCASATSRATMTGPPATDAGERCLPTWRLGCNERVAFLTSRITGSVRPATVPAVRIFGVRPSAHTSRHQ
jgi:hypothetical protein